MATTERDYYELLGVSRGASADEIKRAFRSLARELHPDVSEAPDAEQRFREIVEAYEVLSNSERRELYDRFGHAGLRSGGNGAEPETPVHACPACGGSGRLRQVSRSVFGEFVRTGTCPTCSGSGKLVEHPCGDCHGAGRVIEERTLEVEIPAGIHDGQRIRLSGEGHAGTLGGRAGDVYVEVRVRPDERFVREGNDVYTTVDLTVTQAALGATVSVPTLEGDLELTFEPGTQPGEIRVLRGRGLPVLQGFGRGSQRVLVNVVVPRHLTDEQRRLLEEFERLSTAATYEPSEGFFDKLKSAFR
jgi:molecular chaperone DnaJ